MSTMNNKHNNTPVAPEQVVAAGSPTAGMTLGERIAHVGGRENAQGYIEFGSVMAVDALIKHVLRDLPIAASPEAAPAPAAMAGCQRPNVACAAPECGADCRFSPAATPAAPSDSLLDSMIQIVRDIFGGQAGSSDIVAWEMMNDRARNRLRAALAQPAPVQQDAPAPSMVGDAKGGA